MPVLEEVPVPDEMPLSYARAVGDRLRNLRRQQSLSLLAVEEASGREFKASVLGAYERGERIISVLRLQRLAQLYGVPVDQLLPRPPSGGAEIDSQPSSNGLRPVPADEPVTIDLLRLAALDAPEKEVLRRYVSMIQIQRGDFNGRVITIRREDVSALGRVFELDEPAMRTRLHELGLAD
jgi:transcriptional regulator with XRE-family HTH domain